MVLMMSPLHCFCWELTAFRHRLLKLTNAVFHPSHHFPVSSAFFWQGDQLSDRAIDQNHAPNHKTMRVKLLLTVFVLAITQKKFHIIDQLNGNWINWPIRLVDISQWAEHSLLQYISGCKFLCKQGDTSPWTRCKCFFFHFLRRSNELPLVH